MRYGIPENMRYYPFRVVAFQTLRHGVVLLSCRYNGALYDTPGEQIREEHAKTFEDPGFVVLGERVIERREFSHA